jgi:hypothetical protein
VLAGGLVAGIRAGKAYNTFPLMNGHLVPPETSCSSRGGSILTTWPRSSSTTAARVAAARAGVLIVVAGAARTRRPRPDQRAPLLATLVRSSCSASLRCSRRCRWPGRGAGVATLVLGRRCSLHALRRPLTTRRSSDGSPGGRIDRIPRATRPRMPSCRFASLDAADPACAVRGCGPW